MDECNMSRWRNRDNEKIIWDFIESIRHLYLFYFPMTSHVPPARRWLVRTAGWLVGWYIFHNFRKRRKVTLPCFCTYMELFWLGFSQIRYFFNQQGTRTIQRIRIRRISPLYLSLFIYLFCLFNIIMYLANLMHLIINVCTLWASQNRIRY